MVRDRSSLAQVPGTGTSQGVDLGALLTLARSYPMTPRANGCLATEHGMEMFALIQKLSSIEPTFAVTRMSVRWPI